MTGTTEKRVDVERGDRVELAALFADVARTLHDQPDVDGTLDAVAYASCAAVPGARSASITSMRDGRLVTSAATDELLVRADALQEAAGEGPCLESLTAGRTVTIDDLARTARYPVLAPRLVELGLRSVLAYQLFAGQRRLGALNLFSDVPGAFDEEALQLGEVFSTHAAVALAAAQTTEQLTVAVGTRDLIGQAKGILMERYKLSADAAFALLVKGSQTSHRKLRDVAEELTRTGVDPHIR